MKFSMPIVTSLIDTVAGSIEATNPNLIGEVASVSNLSDAAFARTLSESHSELFCLLVYSSSIDIEFDDLVTSGAIEYYGHSEMMFLVVPETRTIGVRKVGALKIEDSTFALRDFIKLIVGEERAALPVPGLLFFRDILSASDPVYVPVNLIKNTRELGNVVGRLTNVAAEEFSVHPDEWVNRFSVRLAASGSLYFRSADATDAERIVKLLRKLWDARRDLGVLIGTAGKVS
ncbi:hypothetical protein [Roseibium polysiphoniae]|uniref:hypothetical protein n=1 Tax=Roseibium polysiphoniae TaxID=2571221 RepID=UPI00329687F5